MSTSESKSQKEFQITSSKLNLFEKRIIVLTIILMIFNIMDVELTIWGISLQLIEEGNPLMALFIEKYPLYLKIVKLLLSIILGTACWWIRDTSRNLVVYGMGFTVIVYLLIMLVHAHWIYITIL